MKKSEKDRVFTKSREKKFEFDETVAAVFDDMLERSIPLYENTLELICSMIIERKQKDIMSILDIGSSTARLLLKLHNLSNNKQKFKLIGIDNSKAMVERAEKKCLAYGAENIELVLGDIMDYPIKEMDVVVANYTLQFIRPMDRLELVKKIKSGLNRDGEFYFSEKVAFIDRELDKRVIDIYHKYKKSQGYSEYEISGKREALENVLVPFTIDENIKMCVDAGFSSVDTLMQWANFVTFRAKV